MAWVVSRSTGGDESPGPWRFVPYIKGSGRSQVLEYLEALRESDYRAYVALEEVVIPLLEAQGPFKTGPPYWKGLGDGWYEVRSGRERLYCCIEGNRIVVMLVGRTKRWREFRDSDRKVCETARADYRSTEYDQEKRRYLNEKLATDKRRHDGTA